MAKRTQRQSSVTPAMAAGGVPDALNAAHAGSGQIVVFPLAEGQLGFHLGEVAEILRVPPLAQMPLGPRSLLGLANLRGNVLPVVSVRRLLGLADKALDDDSRIIVVEMGGSVGFAVDHIDGLYTFDADRLQSGKAGSGTVDPDLLDGVVRGGEGESSIGILNTKRVLGDAFAGLSRQRPRIERERVVTSEARAERAPQRQMGLVSFDLADQEYALPLNCVREIIPLPQHVAEIARSETAVLGVVTLRDRLLPLVSLRALLGMPPSADAASGKVVVLAVGESVVGMVVDRTREILRIDPDAIDPAPALLTRGAGDAEITSICRLDRGKRLVALLAPERLFRSELMQRVLSDQGQGALSEQGQAGGEMMNDEQFVIFRLGQQEYGLPVAAVEEIARPPETVTRLPKAPAFIDGVMNLRGVVVPIVDLRRRFDIAAPDRTGAQRILILSLGGGKTGFLVDGVAEILRIPAEAIAALPDLSAEQMRLIGRVANLPAEGRMILLADPAQLLDRVEEEVLATFDRTEASQAFQSP